MAVDHSRVMTSANRLNIDLARQRLECRYCRVGLQGLGFHGYYSGLCHEPENARSSDECSNAESRQTFHRQFSANVGCIILVAQDHGVLAPCGMIGIDQCIHIGRDHGFG